MYQVKWIENGENKSKDFETSDDAFMFQTELYIKRQPNENGYDIKPQGVWQI